MFESSLYHKIKVTASLANGGVMLQGNDTLPPATPVTVPIDSVIGNKKNNINNE